jgi:hypothetical protein
MPGFFHRLWTGAKNLASSVWDKVKSPVMAVWNATRPVHGAIWDAIKPMVKSTATGLAEKLPGPIAGIAKGEIEKLKHGGKVHPHVKGHHTHSMAPTVQGGTHAFVMHDGMPQNTFQR